MRRAYIGLSSPTAYFYETGNLFRAEPWHWNPILESPQGLITLFDELWFLSRALCPVNLRDKNFVRFLNEESEFIPLIKGLSSSLVNDPIESFIQDNPIINLYTNLEGGIWKHILSEFNAVIEDVYGQPPGRFRPIDNHSREIDFFGVSLAGNSVDLRNLAFDIAFISRLGLSQIELITNRFNSKVLNTRPANLSQIQTAQGILISRIPALQTPQGPVIERIDSIRENNHLVDFRDKILRSNAPEDFTDLVQDIESEFQRYRNEVLIGRQEQANIVNSISRNASNLILNGILPGSPLLRNILKDTSVQKFNWTSFLAGLENE